HRGDGRRPPPRVPGRRPGQPHAHRPQLRGPHRPEVRRAPPGPPPDRLRLGVPLLRHPGHTCRRHGARQGQRHLRRRGHSPADAVTARGAAAPLGSVAAGTLTPAEEVTSLSATPSGRGYWIFTNRGRVLTFGDAVSYGDMAKVTLNGPVLDSIPTPTGHGYYMVASDGGIFAFGDAVFRGSMGGK